MTKAAKTTKKTEPERVALTAAERKAMQRERDRENQVKSVQLRVSLPVTVSLDEIATALGVDRSEAVARMVNAAYFQMGWLKQKPDGLEYPSSTEMSVHMVGDEENDSWQERKYLSNGKPVKVPEDRRVYEWRKRQGGIPKNLYDE